MGNYFRNESGVGATEFALIGPLLALLFLGSFSSWNYLRQSSNMRDSVEAVAKYYVQGGSNDSQAATIGNTAWTSKPSGGNLAITRSSICGATTVTTLNCPDGTLPKVQLVVTATSTFVDPTNLTIFASYLNLTQSETIRVR